MMMMVINGDLEDLCPNDVDEDEDDIDKEESCVGCGQKPTAVKSWQVPPLSSPLLPPLVCISSISHLDFL